MLDSMAQKTQNDIKQAYVSLFLNNNVFFMINYKRSLAALLAISAIVVAWFGPITPNAYADGLVEALVRFDRMSDSTATSGRVCATPSAAQLAQTEASVQVAFPTGFTVNTTPGWPNHR